MRSHAPFELIVAKFCMCGRVGDVITDAKFYGNRLMGFGVTGTPTKKTPFPILKTFIALTTVLHCDMHHDACVQSWHYLWQAA